MAATQSIPATVAVHPTGTGWTWSLPTTIPGRLELRLGIIVVLSLLASAIAFHAYQRYAAVVRVIGIDTVPSVVAAEKIRTTLADAHTQAVHVFIAKEGSDGPNARAYRLSVAQVSDALVTASQNITYGDEERRPILAIMTQLASYQQLIGMATTGSVPVDHLGKADALMYSGILKSAEELDQANFKYLDQAYSEDRHIAHTWMKLFLGTALLLAALMFEAQYALKKTFRRLFNPALAAGLVVFSVTTLLFYAKAEGVMAEVRAAKEDAFDSVNALAKAQSVAYSANAQQSMYLLLRGQPGQEGQTGIFRSESQKLFSAPIADAGKLPSDLKKLKGQGLLGDELANITYPGEESAARESLKWWLEYLRIDVQVRAFEASGKHAEAVALATGKQTDQSGGAFDNLVRALAGTIAINQAQFDLSIQNASRHVGWLRWLLLPLLLAPILGSVIGLWARIAEYRA